MAFYADMLQPIKPGEKNLSRSTDLTKIFYSIHWLHWIGVMGDYATGKVTSSKFNQSDQVF